LKKLNILIEITIHKILVLGFDKIPWWGKVIMSLAIAIIVYLSVWLVMVPFMKKKIESYKNYLYRFKR